MMLRTCSQSPGDGDTLALAARELVRIFLHIGGGQAHRQQQLDHLVHQRRPIGEQAVLTQGLGDDVAHPPARVEACVRVLEDHLHAAAQRAAFAATPGLTRRLAIEEHLTPRRRV
jgi:hypothetical protein